MKKHTSFSHHALPQNRSPNREKTVRTLQPGQKRSAFKAPIPRSVRYTPTFCNAQNPEDPTNSAYKLEGKASSSHAIHKLRSSDSRKTGKSQKKNEEGKMKYNLVSQYCNEQLLRTENSAKQQLTQTAPMGLFSSEETVFEISELQREKDQQVPTAKGGKLGEN